MNCTISSHIIENFYPRPPRGGRRAARDKSRPVFPISIHALREEGDRLLLSGVRKPRNFYPRPPRGGRPKFDEKTGLFENISIHALREEGDRLRVMSRRGTWLFLSTPSARRATAVAVCLQLLIEHFYPRPPRGGRPVSVPVRYSSFLNFYPRPPRGGRPPSRCYSQKLFCISIHALREEGDYRQEKAIASLIISIHALREEGDTAPSA